ncbi:MAG: LicD family protein, partial [Firmicutes bacterium]|nr:LicD family protein [Bacillota bacterium]
REATVELYRECAQSLGIEVEFAESNRFEELAQGCAFAVVASRFVYPCDAYVQMAARQLPVLFASTYCEPAFLSADLTQQGMLAERCAALMADPARPAYHTDLSQAASNRAFALWEDLVAGLAADRPVCGAAEQPGSGCEEALLAHFDEIFARERPEPEKKRRTLKQVMRRLRYKLRKSKFADFIRRKIYYKERFRVQKYAHIQLSQEQVRKAQLLALKMLFEFERICKKHGLRYYVAAGSLLGAARHGGPIPWDDDVDVTMPRPDYDRFLEVVQDELPDDMELPRSNYPYLFHRMCMKGTRITRYIRQKGDYGIFLDILPLDGAAPTQRLKDRHWRRSQRLFAWMLNSAWPQPPLIPSLKRVRIWTKRLLIKRLVPKRLLFWLWERNAKKYDAESAAEWVCLPGMYGYEKECFPKEYWGEPAWLRYEGREVPVMHEWEHYLTEHYRDYMMPPPALFRRTHTLFAVDFGKYETMTVEEIEKEVEDFGKAAQNR